MASTITNLLGGNLLDGVSKVINSIRGKNPEDAAKLEALRTQYETEFMQAQADIEKARMQENIALNETAGQNIRSEQNDKFSGRARPAVIWGGLLILFINFGVIALLPPRWGYKPLTFPDLFWEVWGICVTGYVFARTADKLFGGNGGTIQGPLGIKLDSKGDGK